MPSRSTVLVVENLPVPFDRRVWQEACALRDDGWRTTVISPAGAGAEERAAVLDGIEILRFPSTPAASAVGYAREYGGALLHVARLLARVSRGRPPGVVHLANPPDVMFLAAMREKLRGAKIIFDQHDAVPEMWAGRGGGSSVAGALRIAERAAYRVADAVIVANESYRSLAIERGGVAPERVFVVRNAPDLRRFENALPDDELKRGRRHLIAYVGLMGHGDGVDVALTALGRLRSDRDDWHAVFLGDGDVLDEMRELASRLGLADRVEFPGRAGDAAIAKVLATASVCLAPEPHGPHADISTMVKVLEYMAAGRPLVAFDLRETIASAGDAALYARDLDEFAGNISRLFDDAGLRKQLGSIGRSRIAGDLSWERSAKALRAAYASVAPT